jgi:hypothetical protein
MTTSRMQNLTLGAMRSIAMMRRLLWRKRGSILVLLMRRGPRSRPAWMIWIRSDFATHGLQLRSGIVQ